MEEPRRRMSSAASWGVEPVSRSSLPPRSRSSCRTSTSVIIGGFYSPTVGVVDSLRANLDARGGAKAGALTVSANTEVLDIEVEHGRVSRVRTTRGDIETECVVVCCGVWSLRLARMAGASIPLTPAVHQMIDFGPVPRFAGARARSSTRSCATWTRTCTSVRTAAVSRWARTPTTDPSRPRRDPLGRGGRALPTEYPFTEDDFVEQMHTRWS